MAKRLRGFRRGRWWSEGARGKLGRKINRRLGRGWKVNRICRWSRGLGEAGGWSGGLGCKLVKSVNRRLTRGDGKVNRRGR